MQLDKTLTNLYPVSPYATYLPFTLAVHRLFTPVAYWLRNGNSCERRRPVPRYRVQAEQSISRAGESLARSGKCLRNGGRPMLDGGGHFGWDGVQTDAEGQFQHLFETGAQAFWIVRIQRARRSNRSFYWRWTWALRRISDGILV